MSVKATLPSIILLVAASGCVPSRVMGPLQRQQDERDGLVNRSRRAGVSEETINAIVPPLSLEETQFMRTQDGSCRSSYLWKNSLTWTGGIMVAVASGFTIGAAYATGSNDTNGKIAFGVSAGSLAALGSILVVVGGLVQQGFTDRGCWMR